MSLFSRNPTAQTDLGAPPVPGMHVQRSCGPAYMCYICQFHYFGSFVVWKCCFSRIPTAQLDFGVIFGRLLGVKIGHFGHRFFDYFCMSFQERPKSAQEPPKSGPRAAKSGQERPKSGPRAPKSAQERPKSGQERPKAAQERPREAQDRPRANKRSKNQQQKAKAKQLAKAKQKSRTKKKQLNKQQTNKKIILTTET